MRIFNCARFGHRVEFGAQRCPTCSTELGYVPELGTIAVLTPTGDPATYSTGLTADPVWRCLNAAWGCNWVLPAGTEQVWCRSCRLTRGRPDEDRPDAMHAWMVAEAAKRRLVHQLDGLGLPIVGRSPEHPDGLAFDFVAVPGARAVTGHLDGVVTLDLAEVNDRYRDAQRRRLGERFRSVIGHLRHEIGHYYWTSLVQREGELDRFRAVFGDEREDYASAVARHYRDAGEEWDAERYITPYAASHPLEDWAETFAYYLHILDATGTAVAHRVIPHAAPRGSILGTADSIDFAAVIASWQPMNVAVNAIAESVGAPPVFPFEFTAGVLDKLSWVHTRAAAPRLVDSHEPDTRVPS